MTWQQKMQKAFQIKDAEPPEARPPYEKTQSEIWHTLCWIIGENAFHQKHDYSVS